MAALKPPIQRCYIITNKLFFFIDVFVSMGNAAVWSAYIFFNICVIHPTAAIF